MVTLESRNLVAGYAGEPVLRGVSVTIEPGEILGIIGPNGSGKSTLLKSLSGWLPPRSGEVLLGGTCLDAIPKKERARIIAQVPQHPSAPPSISTRDLVGFGRVPHLPWLGRPGARDREVVEGAIERCGLGNLSGRAVCTLSGGERQRAWIAMALAQVPSILLLDEPIASLDIAHQLEVLHLLEDLALHHGVGIGIVLHDINLALRYSTRVAVLHQGRVRAFVEPDRVGDRSVLEDVFGVRIIAHGAAAESARQVCFARRSDAEVRGLGALRLGSPGR